ncbi:MAG: hypothetical protein DHS20C01_34880 [marine bacterium B5-7]|nr:MAG: hypothetical protein DHS20C01_34880 [marine bacterium B5-7]
MNKLSIMVVPVILGFSCGVFAQDEAASKAESEAVADAVSEVKTAPDVELTSKTDAGQQVDEVRIEGRLQSVRVKPSTGPAYYIDDRSGDGTLQAPTGGEMDSQFNIRTWKLGTW